jgi:hypothetical protein
MFACWLLALAPVARAQPLFDASRGTLPAAQGWTYGAVGIAAESLVNDSVLLDTTAILTTEAGWSLVPATPLDRAQGYSLLFDLQVNAETHSSTNRAGFSVICLGSDTNGIELGFWNNTIFAQGDSGDSPTLFTHAEEAAFNTTAGFINYSLTLQGTNYVLQANGTTVLSGRARNYTAFSGPVNPYETPNFIFCGDDTTSASGSVNLRSVGLVLPPRLTWVAPGAFTWTGVSNATYRVLGSTDLVAWSAAGTVTSASNTFRFTSTPGPAQQFFRVVFP